MQQITYSRQGSFYLPDLLPPQQPSTPLGTYASLRLQYLKQHRRVLYTNLLTTGKLHEHLADIQKTAQSRMEQMTAQMITAEWITEQLKASDQMQWVQRMNNIRVRAQEQVLRELIYN